MALASPSIATLEFAKRVVEKERVRVRVNRCPKSQSPTKSPSFVIPLAPKLVTDLSFKRKHQHAPSLWKAYEECRTAFLEHHKHVTFHKMNLKLLDRCTDPEIMQVRIDFIENLKITTFDTIQSQHFAEKQVTLFIMSVSWYVFTSPPLFLLPFLLFFENAFFSLHTFLLPFLLLFSFSYLFSCNRPLRLPSYFFLLSNHF